MRLNPAALSKINWTAGLSLVASVAVVFGLDFTVEQQAQTLAVISTVTPTLVLVLRTFFTGKPE